MSGPLRAVRRLRQVVDDAIRPQQQAFQEFGAYVGAGRPEVVELVRVRAQVVQLAVSGVVVEQLPVAGAEHAGEAALGDGVELVVRLALVREVQRRMLVGPVRLAAVPALGVAARELLNGVRVSGQYRPETAALDAERDRRADRLAQCRQQVGERDVDVVLTGHDTRSRDGERDAHQHLRHPRALALQAVVADVVAVVGEEADQRVLGEPVLVQVREQPPQLVVDEPQHAAVRRPVAPPQVVVPGALGLLQLAQPAVRAALRQRGLRTVRAVGYVGEHREVRLRRLVRVVRLGEREPAEERFLLVPLLEPGDRVGHDSIGKLPFQWERSRLERRAVVDRTHPVRERRVLRRRGGTGLVPVRAGERVEILGLAVHVRLTGEVQRVARTAQHVEQVVAAHHLGDG